MAEKKVFRAPIELKDDGEEGTFRSVFSTLNVIDHDNDVVVEGAFREGQEAVIEGWNHDYRLPPGKGVIHTNEKEAWIDGRFFLDTTQGREHYNTLKALGGLEEWSYTFDIEKSSRGEFEGQEEVRFLEALDVWGVAPVTRGASIDTRTVALKAGWTDDEIEQVKALLLRDADVEPPELEVLDSASNGASDGARDGEGEAGDGKPSGWSLRDVQVRIDILKAQL